MRRSKNPPSTLNASQGFRINFGLLQDHLKRSLELVEKGEIDYASHAPHLGYELLCQLPHAGPPTLEQLTFAFLDKSDKPANLNDANLLFLTRRTDAAMDEFNQLIRKYPESGISSAELPELLKKKVTIIARVQRDFKAGVDP